jgi:hypothetical protein
LTGRTFLQERRNHHLKYSLPEKTEGLYKMLIKNQSSQWLAVRNINKKQKNHISKTIAMDIYYAVTCSKADTFYPPQIKTI